MFTCPRRNELMAYQGDRKNEDTWTKRNTCSYCGSIKPEDFILRINNGEEVSPTDKNYKAYIGDHDKFYYPHLDEHQRMTFIELYNNRVMKVGYPGYFYRTPFFMKVIK